MSIDPTPHRAYIAAVAADLANADRRYAVAYEARPEACGLLTATISCSRIGHTVPPPLGSLLFLWDQRAGWRAVPVGRPGADETPLPVPVLASPLTIRQKLPALLEGRTHELAKTHQQWPVTEAHRRLIGRLDVVEDLTRAGWRVFSSRVLPVSMQRGSVVWGLTSHHDFWWEDPPGSDWRDSCLRAPGWSVLFRSSVPGDVIVGAALAAVARTEVRDDRTPRIPQFQDGTGGLR